MKERLVSRMMDLEEKHVKEQATIDNLLSREVISRSLSNYLKIYSELKSYCKTSLIFVEEFCEEGEIMEADSQAKMCLARIIFELLGDNKEEGTKRLELYYLARSLYMGYRKKMLEKVEEMQMEYQQEKTIGESN